MNAPVSDQAVASIEALLEQPVLSWERLEGGANNTVLKIVTAGGCWAAKVYFTDARDPRDRLGAEFGMLAFLWERGVRSIPRPIAADPVNRVGVYEFIAGTPLTAEDIGSDELNQLADLLTTMWKLRTAPGADQRPPASDSGFSIRAHLQAVRRRFDRIRQAVTAAMPDARRFAQEEVQPLLERTEQQVHHRCREYALDLDRVLTREELTLSPADHGFHNVLRRDTGRLAFLDFEYAGWDDPAQTIINACHQPAVPVPDARRPAFTADLLVRLQAGPELTRRLELLDPLLGIKWCLIMLNEFLPVDEARRRFSGRDPVARRANQLAKARAKLAEVRAKLDT